MARNEIGDQMRRHISATNGPGEAPKAAKPSTRKQTSAKVSHLAGSYLALSAPKIVEAMLASEANRTQMAKHIRTLAASCLSQDEVKVVHRLKTYTPEGMGYCIGVAAVCACGNQTLP